MSVMELGAIGEFVGAIAVVATLLYLTVQVRQSGEGMRANAELQMWSWWSEQNRQMTFNGEMIEVLEQGIKDARELSDADRRRFTWFLASMFYMFEVLYRQHARGGLLEDSWKANERLLMGLLQSEAVELWWQSGFFNASQSFHDYVENLREDLSTGDWEWVDIARVYDAVGSRDAT